MLDTSVVIDQDLLDLRSLPQSLVISSVTLAELAAGPLMASTDEERVTRQTLLQRAEAALDPVPFSVAAALAYGKVSAAVAAIGRKPRGQRAMDLLIAAAAAADELPLYMRNPDDFVGLEDLVEIVAV